MLIILNCLPIDSLTVDTFQELNVNVRGGVESVNYANKSLFAFLGVCAHFRRLDE